MFSTKILMGFNALNVKKINYVVYISGISHIKIINFFNLRQTAT